MFLNFFLKSQTHKDLSTFFTSHSSQPSVFRSLRIEFSDSINVIHYQFQE